jgi:hypothetical protein
LKLIPVQVPVKIIFKDNLFFSCKKIKSAASLQPPTLEEFAGGLKLVQGIHSQNTQSPGNDGSQKFRIGIFCPAFPTNQALFGYFGFTVRTGSGMFQFFCKCVFHNFYPL